MLICVARVLIAVGIAWPNHLAVICNVYDRLCLVVRDHPQSSCLSALRYQASARTLVVLDVDFGGKINLI